MLMLNLYVNCNRQCCYQYYYSPEGDSGDFRP